MKADGTIWIDTKIDESGMEDGFNRLRDGADDVAVSFRNAGKVIEKSFSNINFNKTIENLRAQIRSLETEFDAVSKEFEDAIKFDDDKAAEKLGAKRTRIYDRLARARERLAVEVASAAQKEAAAEEKASQRVIAAEEKEAAQKRKLNSEIVKTGDSFSYFGNRLRGIVTSALVFNIISAGLRKVTSYFGSALMANNQFATAVGRLRGSLMIAFQPIYEAVLPALTTLVNWLNMAVQAVGRFFAALSGKSYSAMKTNAQALNKQASSIKNVGKAAEESEKYLAGFDEINRMMETPKTDVGDVTDDSNMVPVGVVWDDAGFEDKLSPKIQALVNKIKQLIAPLKEIDFAPLKKSLSRLGESFKNLGSTIGSALEWAWFNILVPFATWTIEEAAPALIDVLAAAFGVLNEVLQALQPLGQWLWDNFLQPLAAWAGDKIVDVINWLADALTRVSDWISEHQTLIQNIAVVVGAFAAAWKLVNSAITIWNTLSSVATAVTTGFGAAVSFLSSPIGIAVLAIGALIAIIALLIYNWDEVKEAAIACWEGIKKTWSTVSKWFNENVVQPVKNWFADLFKNISEKVQGVRESISEHFSKAATAIEERFVKPVQNWWQNLKENIVNAISRITESIESKFTKAAQVVESGFISPIKQKMEYASNWISEKFMSAIEKIQTAWYALPAWFAEKVTGPVIELFNQLTGGLVEGFNATAESVNGAIEDLGDVFNRVVNNIASAIADMVAEFNSLAGKLSARRAKVYGSSEASATSAAAYPAFPVMDVPMLARGAVIPPNHKFLAVLGDQRIGTNVEAPLSTIQEAVAIVMEDMIQSNLAGHEATVAILQQILEAVLGIELDGETISRAMNNYNMKMAAAKGGLA